MNNENDVHNTGILFLFDNRNGSINGDRANNNIPRINSDGYAIVTSNCIKSMIREYIKKSKGSEYIMRKIDTEVTDDLQEEGNETVMLRDLNMTKEEIKQITNEEFIEKLKLQYIDYRLFGSFIGKESGPCQIYTAKSLNKTKITKYSGTTVLSSKEEKKTGTFRKNYTTEYAIFSCYGIINPNLSKFTNMKKDDCDVLINSIKNTFSECSSRSKHNSKTRLVLTVILKNKNYKISDLSKKILLRNENKVSKYQECVFEVDGLISYLRSIKDQIEKITLYEDGGCQYYCNNKRSFYLRDVLQSNKLL